MTEQTVFPTAVLVVAAVTMVAVLARNAFRRAGLPALVAFIGMGVALRLAGDHWEFLGGDVLNIVEFLSRLGVVSLLFRVGLESDLPGLLRNLRRAGIIWAGNVVLSGTAGYVAARYLLGFELIPSLFAATALTATSVGIAVKLWRDAGMLETDAGETMLDVAELDDISGIVLMALLFGLIPVLR
ncbi:MAG: cation:proton antiporter, partial [Candidatus Eisenbacteria bacterium]|nr:cation:proton antiporter [Candidatus Eisenbacteria bacterium]